jgi:hypothetical protein
MHEFYRLSALDESHGHPSGAPLAPSCGALALDAGEPSPHPRFRAVEQVGGAGGGGGEEVVVVAEGEGGHLAEERLLAGVDVTADRRGASMAAGRGFPSRPGNHDAYP